MTRLIIILFVSFSVISLSQIKRTSDLKPDPANRDGKDYAIFFAIKDYDEWKTLSNPIRDAESIAKILAHQYGFDTTIIRNPGKNEIQGEIQQLLTRKFNPDDQLMIFFTGHGLFVPHIPDSEEGEGYFIPNDAKLNDPFQNTYLSYAQLIPKIDNIQCKHILVAIDACYSGTFFSTSKGELLPKRKGELSQREKIIEQIRPYKTRIAITSGGKVRTNDGLYHSPFTEQFLNALNDGGEEDQILVISELYGFLQKITPRPLYGYFRDSDKESSDFMFIRDSLFWRIPESEGISEVIDEILIDKRSIQRQYKTKIFQEKRWMIENINHDEGLGTWCYGDKDANCATYGRLYNWDSAKKACEGLDNGWRLPTEEEWRNLINAYEGPKKAYAEFIKNGSSGMDLSMGGIRYSDGSYSNLGKIGYYWTGTEETGGYAKYFYLPTKNKKVLQFYSNKEDARSCRCIQDIEKLPEE